MSKERALLNLCAVTLKARNICPLLLKDISELLAQPEQKPKREPLSDEKLEIMYSKHAFAMDKQEYMWGFRDAERTHGIGVDNDS